MERGWTLSRYEAMQDHWKHFGPPAYMAVAAYLGLTKKRSDSPSRTSVTEASVAEDFMRDFMAAGGRMQ